MSRYKVLLLYQYNMTNKTWVISVRRILPFDVGKQRSNNESELSYYHIISVRLI
jgi:hypothetical protein